MVIKIHQTASTKEAFNYNEQKVEQGQAHFFHSRNTTELRPFVYPASQRLAQLLAIENGNTRCHNKCFHVSVNPTNEELEILTKEGVKKEIDAFMKYMGYGAQPYFVYEHADLKRSHFHIVSTRINVITQKKINDSNEKRKVNQFIQELQQRYCLEVKSKKTDKVNLIPTIHSTHLHEGIQQVFKLLNQSNIVSRQEYFDILKAFNLELYQSDQGQTVIVKDSHGQTLRHPIALSQFKEPPNLSVNKTKALNEELHQKLLRKTEHILKDLNKNYRFYTIDELREAFIRQNLLPFTLTKNGNLNIYSPLDKTVLDAQFLLKRHRMRLQGFVLTNDQFYAIVREFTQQNKLTDIVHQERSFVNKGVNEIALKGLNLETCSAYNQIALQLNSEQQEVVQKAVQNHLKYMAARVLEQSPFNSGSHRNRQDRSLWDKVNHQFIMEVLNYQDWGERKSRNQQKRNSKRRKSRRF
ncbi:relaxase/mobilization nuclease domain-containing protein [Carboxylicivirga sp. RSCT41]|uniref:relaxase/mobilization nuclease domain-containing protein n=1 Tax=Carboxylicivirga agarovorans TaxID=3417570 RepID=UPI003D332F58